MRSFGDSPQSGALSRRTHSRLLFMQNFSWAVLAFEVMGPFCFKRNYWPSEPQSASRCPGCYRALCRVSKVPVLQEGFVEDCGLSPCENQASGPRMALGSKDSCFAEWWVVPRELAVLAVCCPPPPRTISPGKSQTPWPSQWRWLFGARGEVPGSR